MATLFLKLLSKLSLVTLYRLSDLLSGLAFILYRRGIVYKNLEIIFPGIEPLQKKQIARKFYSNLLDMGVELIKMQDMTSEDILERISFKEDEVYLEIVNNPRPILFFTTHLFNWEWMCAATQIKVFPSYPVYKKLKNDDFDRFIYNLRSKFGATPLEMKQSLRKIMQLDGLAGIGLLADQSPFLQNKGKIWSKFMGKETSFFKGTMALPYLTQYPSYFAWIQKQKRGHYHVSFHRLSKPPYSKSEQVVFKKYIELSEKAIKERPEEWLLTHNRWKYRRQENEEIIIFPS